MVQKWYKMDNRRIIQAGPSVKFFKIYVRRMSVTAGKRMNQKRMDGRSMDVLSPLCASRDVMKMNVCILNVRH